MKVSDMDDRYILEIDSQDVISTLEYLGIGTSDFNFLFCIIDEGDYIEVWGGYGIPYMSKELYCLRK